MREALIELRVNQLKAMDQFVHEVNDEELIDDWLKNGVPDEASEDDYEEIAADDKLYYECVKIFKHIAIEDDVYY